MIRSQWVAEGCVGRRTRHCSKCASAKAERSSHWTAPGHHVRCTVSSAGVARQRQQGSADRYVELCPKADQQRSGRELARAEKPAELIALRVADLAAVKARRHATAPSQTTRSDSRAVYGVPASAANDALKPAGQTKVSASRRRHEWQGGGSRSLLRHAGLAQAGEKRVLDQRLDLRHAETACRLQPGDARIAAVAAQPSSLCEFSGGALGLAVESAGGGEPRVNHWQLRVGAACLFEPHDCFVCS